MEYATQTAAASGIPSPAGQAVTRLAGTAEAPRRVEHRLTSLGRILIEPIEVLTNWARDYGGAIIDFQVAAEAAASARARAAG